MSNNGYITSRRYISSYNIVDMLNEINDRRFGGKLLISEEVFEDGSNYYVNYFLNEQKHGIYFWQLSARKLAIPHPQMPFSKYLKYVFSEELGVKMDGIMSDECDESDKWKPDPSKYKKYTAWFAMLHKHIKKVDKKLYDRLLAWDISVTPPELQSY